MAEGEDVEGREGDGEEVVEEGKGVEAPLCTLLL